MYLDQLVLSYGGLTDTTAPKLSLQYNAASNTVTGTVKDDIDGAAIPTIHVTYDGKSYTSYTYSQSSGALSISLPAADGAQHRVNVVAGDASGNLSRAGVNAGTSSATPAFADMRDHWRTMRWRTSSAAAFRTARTVTSCRIRTQPVRNLPCCSRVT